MNVRASAKIICKKLNLRPKFYFSGGKSGWIGDQPFVFLNTKKIRNLGWKNKKWRRSHRGLNKPTLLWRALEIVSTKGCRLERDDPYKSDSIDYPTDLENNRILYESKKALNKANKYRIKKQGPVQPNHIIIIDLF